jgi:hypothetical protein
MAVFGNERPDALTRAYADPANRAAIRGKPKITP